MKFLATLLAFSWATTSASATNLQTDGPAKCNAVYATGDADGSIPARPSTVCNLANSNAMVAAGKACDVSRDVTDAAACPEFTPTCYIEDVCADAKFCASSQAIYKGVIEYYAYCDEIGDAANKFRVTSTKDMPPEYQKPGTHTKKKGDTVLNVCTADDCNAGGALVLRGGIPNTQTEGPRKCYGVYASGDAGGSVPARPTTKCEEQSVIDSMVAAGVACDDSTDACAEFAPTCYFEDICVDAEYCASVQYLHGGVIEYYAFCDEIGGAGNVFASAAVDWRTGSQTKGTHTKMNTTDPSMLHLCTDDLCNDGADVLQGGIPNIQTDGPAKCYGVFAAGEDARDRPNQKCTEPSDIDGMIAAGKACMESESASCPEFKAPCYIEDICADAKYCFSQQTSNWGVVEYYAYCDETKNAQNISNIFGRIGSEALPEADREAGTHVDPDHLISLNNIVDLCTADLCNDGAAVVEGGNSGAGLATAVASAAVLVFASVVLVVMS